MICLVCLINRAFCMYMDIFIEEAPNMVGNLSVKKCGVLVYKAIR